MATLRADFAAALCKDNSYFRIRSPNRPTRPTYPFNNHVEVYGDAIRRGHLKTRSCFERFRTAQSSFGALSLRTI